MRVISGLFKGRRINGGKNFSIRPTTDRIKESIFTILGDYVSGSQVLDLFGGSGSLGIEALSRGAEKVTFIEQQASSIAIMKKNIHQVGIIPGKFEIIQSEVLHFCSHTPATYDIILADPPFHYPPLQKLIATITSRSVLNERGVLIIEHEISNPLEENTATYSIIKQKKYGRSLVSFIMRSHHE